MHSGIVCSVTVCLYGAPLMNPIGFSAYSSRRDLHLHPRYTQQS